MKVEISYTNGNEIFMKFEGNIFTENLQELKKALDIVLDTDVDGAVIDLASVNAITSFGLKELMLFEKKMMEMGKSVKYLNATHIVSELFKIAKKVYA